MVIHTVHTYFITVGIIWNIHASKCQIQEASGCVASGCSHRRNALCPHIQAFLSHPCVSVLLCVHSFVVTCLWQQAEHSREMVDPE